MKKLSFIATNYIDKPDGVSVYLENILYFLLNDKVFLSKVLIDIYLSPSLYQKIKNHSKSNINLIVVDGGSISKILKLQLKLLQKRYDLIFFSTPMPIFLGFGKKIKVIHDLTIKKIPKYFSKYFHLYIDLLILNMKFFDYKIGYISKQTKDDIQKHYSIEDKKLIYVPNGIPQKVQIQKTFDTEKILKKFDSNTLQIIVVGRINKAKGFDRILKFLNYYEKNPIFSNFILHIAGKQTDETKELFDKKSYKNINLNFYGFVSDKQLNKLYQKSHYCLFLSRNEGFGLPLVEALWHKTIPLISDIDVFSEIVGENFPKFNNKTGFDKHIQKFIEKTFFNKDYLKKILDMMLEITNKHKDRYKQSALTIKELLLKDD